MRSSRWRCSRADKRTRTRVVTATADFYSTDELLNYGMPGELISCGEIGDPLVHACYIHYYSLSRYSRRWQPAERKTPKPPRLAATLVAFMEYLESL